MARVLCVKIPKVWGKEVVFANTDAYTGKILYVQPGYRCSTHLHRLKDETFMCVEGSGVISAGGAYHRVGPGSAIRIRPGTWHFFASLTGMTLIEASTRHRDSDVEREDESRPIVMEEDPLLWNMLEGE